MNKEYKSWFVELKSKIKSVQIKSAIAVNSALIEFYYELGKMISEKENVWGSKLLETLSMDLKIEFPDLKGFSVSNLKYCKLFYNYFSISPQLGDELKKQISPELVDELENKISPQLVDELENKISPQLGDELAKMTQLFVKQSVFKLPWGHIKLIIDKIKDLNQATFYVKQTIENSWSRDTLALQIKSNLYERSGKAITNFKNTLPEPYSDLAQQTLKDPYNDINKPMGVSEFQITENLPDNLKSSLPTIEEIERELKNY